MLNAIARGKSRAEIQELVDAAKPTRKGETPAHPPATTRTSTPAARETDTPPSQPAPPPPLHHGGVYEDDDQPDLRSSRADLEKELLRAEIEATRAATARDLSQAQAVRSTKIDLQPDSTAHVVSGETPVRRYLDGLPAESEGEWAVPHDANPLGWWISTAAVEKVRRLAAAAPR